MDINSRLLEEQRKEFAARKFLAMPIAGMIMWSIVSIGASFSILSSNHGYSLSALVLSPS